MAPATAEQLWQDMLKWGTVAAMVPRDTLRTLLPSKRADRLHAWVRDHGAEDPRPVVRNAKRDADPTGGQTHLVIPDTHAQPGQDLRRFTWLGRMVAEIKPDVAVSLGDWDSFDSLCGPADLIDRVKSKTRDELATSEIAVKLFEAGLGGVPVRKVITPGNHDIRPQKLALDEPWLDGALGAVCAAHKAAGWEVGEFNKPLRIDGVRYQHYLTGKGSNKPIAGKFHALRLLERVNFGESVVVGHSHLWQHYSAMSGPKRVHGLVAGCAFEHHEDYASDDDNAAWQRGVTVLRNVVDGDFEIEYWSLARIRDTFGD